MMGWLRVVGMVPPEPNTYWSEGTFEAWPADRSKMDWADGTRRAAFPITGTVAGGGTRFGSTREAGDVYVPGANIGDSIDPPVLEIIVRLRDGILGEWKEFRGTGKVVATAPGEWNINAPLGGVMTYVNTPGVPAGALTQADLGGSVPRIEDFNSAMGRIGALESRLPVTLLADNSKAPGDSLHAYPWGVSYMNVVGVAGWPLDYGFIQTVRILGDPLGIKQTFYAFHGQSAWIRAPKAPDGGGDPGSTPFRGMFGATLTAPQIAPPTYAAGTQGNIVQLSQAVTLITTREVTIRQELRWTPNAAGGYSGLTLNAPAGWNIVSCSVAYGTMYADGKPRNAAWIGGILYLDNIYANTPHDMQLTYRLTPVE